MDDHLILNDNLIKAAIEYAFRNDVSAAEMIRYWDAAIKCYLKQNEARKS